VKAVTQLVVRFHCLSSVLDQAVEWLFRWR
jgi:hypothetical protein